VIPFPNRTLTVREGKSNMPKKIIEFPKFKNESDEADWWASAEGRAFAEQKSREAQKKGIKFSGSPLMVKLNKKKTVNGRLEPL
jgi:hypothetical protein